MSSTRTRWSAVKRNPKAGLLTRSRTAPEVQTRLFLEEKPRLRCYLTVRQQKRDRLKDKPAGENKLVIISVKLRSCDLHARAGCKTYAARFIVGMKLEFLRRHPGS
jgi:hypothetical protein